VSYTSGQQSLVYVCRLFSVDADVEAELYVSYTFKLPTSCSDVQLGIGLTLGRPPSQLWLVGDESDDYSGLCRSDVSRLRFAQQQNIGTWTTRYLLVTGTVIFNTLSSQTCAACSANKRKKKEVLYPTMSVCGVLISVT